MTEKEAAALWGVIASAIKIVIDVGCAIKTGAKDDRDRALTHIKPLLCDLDELTREDERGACGR